MLIKKDKEKVFWGDEPQDVVDDYLKRRGFRPELIPSKEQLEKLYNMASEDKKLRKKINKIFIRALRREAKQKEIDLHICSALRTKEGLPKGCGVIKKYKPVKQKSGLYNIFVRG